MTRVITEAAWKVAGAGSWHVNPYYSPRSFWNRPIDLGGTDALAADQSQAQHVANQLQYGRAGRTPFGYSGVGYGNNQWPYSLGLNASSYSFPIYCCDGSTPRQPVGLYSTSGSRYFSLGTEFANLQAYMNSVPIPDKTLCPKITGVAPDVDIWAAGTDAEIFIMDRDTREGWEAWELSNSNAAASAVTGTTWTAQMGGYIANVDEFSGVFPNQWGAKATSLGGIGGMITLQDIRDVYNGGSINHALCFALAMNGGAGSQVPPATRADGPGSNNVPVIPSGFPGAGGANPAYRQDASREGGRFTWPASAVAGLPTPMGVAIAEAINVYGLVLADTTGDGALYVEDPRTQGSIYHMQGAGAVDPWSYPWAAGNPFLVPGDPPGWTVLHHFPWDQLQVLQPVIA